MKIKMNLGDKRRVQADELLVARIIVAGLGMAIVIATLTLLPEVRKALFDWPPTEPKVVVAVETEQLFHVQHAVLLTRVKCLRRISEPAAKSKFETQDGREWAFEGDYVVMEAKPGDC